MIIETIGIDKAVLEECINENIRPKEGTLGKKNNKGKEVAGQLKLRIWERKGILVKQGP